MNLLNYQFQLDDYTDDPSTTGTIGIGDTESGTLEQSSDRDWFAVNLQSGVTYEFRLNGQSLADPYLRIYDNSERLVGLNDDSNGSLDSQVTFTAPSTGTYYLEAGAYADFYTGSYTLSTYLADDYASDQTTDGVVAMGDSVSGELEQISDRDWFAIDLEAGATYNFFLEGEELSDPYLRLYDEDGNFITYNDDTENSLDSALSFTATSSETYYLSAGSFADVYTGSYELSAELVSPPPTSESEPGETLNTAFDFGILQENQTLQTQNSVSPTDQLDIYQFRLDSPLTIAAQLNNLSSDIDLALLDSNGNPIDFSTNSQTQNELITQNLDTGDYYLAVYPYSGASEFNLELSATMPPELPTSYNSATGYGEVEVDQALATLLNTEVPTIEPLGENNWGLDRIGAPSAWEMGYTGEDAVIAVLDTGVDWTHPDLNNNIWRNSDEIPNNNQDDDGNGYVDDVIGWDFANNDNNPDDINGHGTHVAGTIAAEENNFGITGVAPDAEIMPVQVLGDDGSGFNSDIITGIDYAVANGADVINLSLGGSNMSPGINAAIQEASDAGTLVVMAAGNSAGATPENPGAFAVEEGLVVGALNQAGDLSSFSNRAGEIPQDFNGDGFAFPSYVTAAGVDVLSTIPEGNYAYFSGTSMATPHVAGAAGILMGANPELTPEQGVDLITGTAMSDSSTVSNVFV